MTPRVEAVLFDLGRVLIEWDPYLPYVGRYARPEVERFFADVDFPAFNHRQDAGRPWADARAELMVEHPHHVPLLDVYVDHFAEAVPHEVPGASMTVDAVLAAGVRAVGLTNWSAETYAVAPRQAPVIGRLAGVLVSGEVGIAKPDPRVFELAAERFDLTPSTTLFVDDSAPNVHAAEDVGYLGHVFTRHRGLRQRLRALGVALPSEADLGGDPGRAPGRTPRRT